ncbi:ATP-dependent RNA helicase [Galdieria sulphuraria]|uniref:ATP-dependent RNA helicase n=1 Tax=Galdieria sulphuraria TaxID=130081 RepID=M2XGW1_GALSU|nr:ATP-dependent RNA helicase [Galdieria sulphuraria]EME29307.1 ATP-dependent RNA helicase [Galdieria sulphuraria]|eukprot:XP_005705827.1 ATP-dependent RNA helicase [Galdieria sulphuraria]
MESVIVEVLHGLLPKPSYYISSLDDICFGELTESLYIARASEEGDFYLGPVSSSNVILEEYDRNFGKSASESTSLQRETQGDYHSGSTRNKPFATSVTPENGCIEEETIFWETYQQKLFEYLQVDKSLIDMNNYEITRENLLEWCGVTSLAQSRISQEHAATESKNEFLVNNSLVLMNSKGSAFVESSLKEKGAATKANTKPLRFLPSVRQDPFEWKKFFSFTTKELNMFGVTRKELQDSRDLSNSKEGNKLSQISSTYLDNPSSLAVDKEEEHVVENIENWDDLQSIHVAIDRLLSNERVNDILRNKPKLGVDENNREDTMDSKSYAILDEQDVESFEQEVRYPARTFPFKLDDFQKRGILHLEREENVFVTAHTSAGKTVIAEYAIALAIQHQTRAIYTSPIKSLSNQKYRDFLDNFRDVGIVTGDVSIHPEASCLIMTTEILRSMLYKGADLIRDIEFVIFDEVHYINDEERGVVWEEVIIMLPSYIKLIMLSATVPNAMDFAKWVGAIRKSKVFVVGTHLRPVPLQHCIFFRKHLYTLVTAEGKFMTSVYKQLKELAKYKMIPSSDIRTSGAHPWRELVYYLNESNLVPAVIFCFAKKRCDELANLLSNVDLTIDSSEKFHIISFIDKSISRLQAEDRIIPQIERLREMLSRGIGIHHAGIIPLMKEVVEILFQKGFVRVLFATETFAMGVNMPAKTVIFSSIRKHDGRKFRWMQPGEYIQMAGRAGRRGIDSVGTVLLFLEEDLPEMNILRKVMIGQPVNLLSQFRLTYNMILNLLRTEDLQVEDMIRHSFCEAPYARDVSVMSKLLVKGDLKLKHLEERIARIQDRSLHLTTVDFKRFYSVYVECEQLTQYLAKTTLAKTQCLQNYLDLGRIVQVLGDDFDIHFAVIIGFTRNARLEHFLKEKTRSYEATHCNTDMLEVVWIVPVYQEHPKCKPEFVSKLKLGTKILSGKIGRYEWRVERISLDRIVAPISEKIHQMNLFYLYDAASFAFRTELNRMVDRLRLLKENGKVVPFVRIPPTEDMGYCNPEIQDAWKRREALIEDIEKSPVNRSFRKFTAMKMFELYHELEWKLAKIRWALSDDSLQLMPDYNLRVEVLKKLGFINEEHIIQLKGRAACELNICDCVLATEVIFENVLNPLDSCECAAFLSSFVFEGSTKCVLSSLTDPLLNAIEALGTIAHRVGNVQNECGLPISAEEFAQQNIRTGLSDVVLLWAQGVKFVEICEVTEVPEGTIIRVINRLITR